MAKQTDGRLSLQLDIFGGLVLYRHKRLTVNGVISYFVRKEAQMNLNLSYLYPDDLKQQNVHQRNERSLLLMNVH